MRWIALLGLVLAACASPSSATRASGEGWGAHLEWAPARPRALRPVALRLRVEDPTGKPLPLTRLRVTASMPRMTHRAEDVPFRRIVPGTYEATHTFSMDGRWELRVEGTTAPGAQVTATFTLDVGP